LGEVLGLLEGKLQRLDLILAHANPADRVEAFKGHRAEGVQVAQAKKTLLVGLHQRLLAADTYLQLAKIGMADRQILANETYPAADRAVGVAKKGGLLARGLSVR
jgi:hypothetical protein